MTVTHLPFGVVQVAFGCLVGTMAGLLHFTTLHWCVRLLSVGAPGKAVAVHGARLGVLVLTFFVLAKLGPWALLCGAHGLLLARDVVLRRVRVAR
ncbi:N-ATPase subunit AtpR [Caballeronia arationis]|uniref:N-ATPase subunit AtpR n=1 Tax=Caballeronia arationis TaxID=1777142 RepID=UPI000788C34B|nr:ATP synthase subunit I [Caballeronia arationis]